MNESADIDSILRGQSMPRPYSNDLRARVIEAIEAGASRREAADHYELSPSVVVLLGPALGRNWRRCSEAKWRQYFAA